jgi:hypothetical protein
MTGEAIVILLTENRVAEGGGWNVRLGMDVAMAPLGSGWMPFVLPLSAWELRQVPHFIDCNNGRTRARKRIIILFFRRVCRHWCKICVSVKGGVKLSLFRRVFVGDSSRCPTRRLFAGSNDTHAPKLPINQAQGERIVKAKR